jgi:betaine lipid synthase
MLGLVAAQLKHKAKQNPNPNKKPIWVDIGGGTGYNIEAMQAYLDVPNFFSKVYLVDLSPSLLDVARKRFDRLGWDVEVVCQDARTFRLQDYENRHGIHKTVLPQESLNSGDDVPDVGAGLVTLSYSLSMIPDYYSVVDSIPSLLSSDGILGVVDFYVQSIVEISGRTYTGGSFNRHVTWLGRVFWRAWFDVDRVGLEGARRDYLEYRFGTLKTVDERNYLLCGIPYYSRASQHMTAEY